MKNLESLVLVLCLLVVLGCKCQSDLFDSVGKTPTSATATPASPTPSASSTPHSTSTPAERTNKTPDEEANETLETGTYTGSGLNVTYNKRGDIMLRIDSVSASGSVKAFFRASNGLYGSSKLTGTLEDGKLLLDGTLEDGKAISVNATVSGDTINGGYGISDAKLNTQSGNFKVTLE